MTTVLRRLFWLALLGGASFAAWSLWQRRSASAAANAPVWPPLDAPTPPSGHRGDGGDAEAAPARLAELPDDHASDEASSEAAARWVEPVDGACPASHPIKANDNSGIYHVPGGRFYDRTGPERCYARAEDAETDGYRASKS